MKLAFILLLISFSVLAREKGETGVGLGIGPTKLTGPTRLDDPAAVGFGAGIWGKYTFSERVDFDLSYHRLNFADIPTYTNSVSLGVSFIFVLDQKLKPYGHFGLGAGTIPHNGRSDDNKLELLSTIGAGVEYQLSKKLLATFQADFHAFIPTRNNNNQLYALAPLFGLTYYWEATKVAAVPCTSVPSVVVDAPISTTMSAVQRIDTFQTIEVQPPKKDLPNINVKFFAGKATISHYYHDELNRAAKIVKHDKNLKIIVTGHADKSGSSRTNKALSKARAEAVKTYLVKKLAVNPDDIVVRDYGTSRPEASNKDPEGRSANRRAEAKFMEVITD